MWSKSQRSKNQCKAWFFVPMAIIKCECWAPACAFPLFCQQEQSIGNCEHSEADHMSLAHKPHSKAPSPLWLLCRNTENPLWARWPGDWKVPLLVGFISCHLDSFSDDPGSCTGGFCSGRTSYEQGNLQWRQVELLSLWATKCTEERYACSSL